MSDEFEQLEKELAGLRPAPVSAELKGRIADAIARSDEAKRDVIATIGPGGVRGSRNWGSQSAGLIAAAAAIAACIVVMVSVATHEGGSSTVQSVRVARGETTEAVASASSYRKALAESPEALDRLLDRDATRLLASAASSRTETAGDWPR